MTQFNYTITDPMGLHARPAGLLVKKILQYESAITITLGEKTVDAKRLFGVMSLVVRPGDTVTVAADGADESKAAAEIEEFVKGLL